VRIDQFVPSMVSHDAISNHVLQLQSALRAAGLESEVFAEAADRELRRRVHPFDGAARSVKREAVLYHASVSSSIVSWLKEIAQAGPIAASNYHNVTPARFFDAWSPRIADSLRRARTELESMSSVVSIGIADSPFNEGELRTLGYRRTNVCPLLIDLDAYERKPDARTSRRLQRARDRGGGRWLFVGRIAPNKCQHDVVAAFAVYRRVFDPSAHLTLLGPVTSLSYLRRLESLIDELGVGASVELAHGVPFSHLLAYYRCADVFVCLSEHEGFCVPILEAMQVGLPVVAYGAAAIPDTLGRAGVVLERKDPLSVAVEVHDLVADPPRNSAVVAAGRARASDFALPSTSEQFVSTLTRWAADAD
jgi:L-malate glycosyltransferase